jgi:hypothetical protein
MGSEVQRLKSYAREQQRSARLPRDTKDSDMSYKARYLLTFGKFHRPVSYAICIDNAANELIEENW